MASKTKDLTITFLGCGKLSSAIVEGIISSLQESPYTFLPSPDTSIDSDAIPVVPRSLVACVRHQESARSLEQRFGARSNIFSVWAGDSLRGVRLGEIVVLGVEPSVFRDVLAEPGMKDALAGKILVSLVAGASAEMIEEAIYGGDKASISVDAEKGCRIVRVLPNIAVAVRQSISLIIEDEGRGHYPPDVLNIVSSLFLRVGEIKVVPSHYASTAPTMSASSQAFFALMVEALVDGVAKCGLNRADSLELAVASLKGTVAIMATGQDPSDMRKNIATPGGATAAGLKDLEERGIRGMMEQAALICTRRFESLGNKLS